MSLGSTPDRISPMESVQRRSRGLLPVVVGGGTGFLLALNATRDHRDAIAKAGWPGFLSVLILMVSVFILIVRLVDRIDAPSATLTRKTVAALFLLGVAFAPLMMLVGLTFPSPGNSERARVVPTYRSQPNVSPNSPAIPSRGKGP